MYVCVCVFRIMSNGLLAAIFFFQLLLLLLLRPTVSENFEKWQNAIDESKPEWSWPKNTWLPCGALQWHQKKISKQKYSQKGAYSSAGRERAESGLQAERVGLQYPKAKSRVCDFFVFLLLLRLPSLQHFVFLFFCFFSCVFRGILFALIN